MKFVKILGTLLTYFLSTIIILITLVVAYVCIDFFEIIDIPEKYRVESYVEDHKEELVEIKEVISKKILSKEDEEKISDEELQAKYEAIWNILNNGSDAYQDTNISKENSLYFSQLDNYAVILYNGLLANKDKLKSGTYVIDYGTSFNDLLNTEEGEELLNLDFQLAVDAFLYDNPDIFYIDVTKVYLLTEITSTRLETKYKIKIGPSGDNSYLSDYFSSAEEVEDAIALINSEKNNILLNKNSKNTYESVKYIHDYLVENVEYEKENKNQMSYSIYGVFVLKKAVCEGYARAFKYLLDSAGIPCYICVGDAINSSGETEAHAWNMVELNGMWYGVDATWDDPIIIGNGKVTNAIKYAYFLKGKKVFDVDHFENGKIIDEASFTYPELSYTDY